jgi:hypothetical protein
VVRLTLFEDPGELNPSGSNVGGKMGGVTTIMAGWGAGWAR